MKSAKKILFWLATGTATEEQRQEARSAGAQFRNARYYDPESEEPASEVMGDVPKGSYIGVKGGTPKTGSAGKGTGSETSGAGSEDDSEEIEITAQYIGSLLKADLIELAREEKLELTGHEKVDELKGLLMAHFDLQE